MNHYNLVLNISLKTETCDNHVINFFTTYYMAPNKNLTKTANGLRKGEQKKVRISKARQNW
jgi:hypothetical protein